MGLPKKLTDMQMKFAQILVYNEGRLYGYECAIEAGYNKDRARQEASELQNPQKSPLVVKYISELKAEMQKKYDVSYGSHLVELGKLRNDAHNKGAWSAAVNAEVARGKAGGLYVEQKIIRTGKIDDMSPEEVSKRVAEILEVYSPIVEGQSNKEIEKKIRAKQVEIRTNPIAREKSKKTKPLQPMKKVIDDNGSGPTSTSS